MQALAVMRYILSVVAIIFLAACTQSPPLGVFDVLSSTNERVIGHCITDPSSVEATAYRERTKELIAAKADGAPFPSFRVLSVRQPDYRYVLYVPETSALTYHIVCPFSGDRQHCTIAGQFTGGFFEASMSLKDLPHAEAAARAALAACVPMTANNSFKPNLLRYGKSVAQKACHAFSSTTQVGLIQALYTRSSG